MSRFLKHVPCPKCNSRDNLALYEGGSGYCFGCGYYLNPTKSPYLYEDTRTTISGQGVVLPEDFILGATSERGTWGRTFIRITDLIQRRVGESESRNQLIFTWWDDSDNLLLYQARNFNPGSKLKYYTAGKPEEVLPIYYKDLVNQSRTDTLVVVEDAISAIKIARQSDSMPVLGSDLSLTKINRLARLYGAFVIWLDSDMYAKAQRIARRLQMLGGKARAVWTELDPKYYDNKEISKNIL